MRTPARTLSEEAIPLANRTALRPVSSAVPSTSVSSRSEPPPRALAAGSRRTAQEWFNYAWNHWASRSLLIGAVATCLDVCILLLCVEKFGLPNPAGSMIGVVFGSTFTFFANRHFAFQDHHPELAPQAVKFAVATSLATLVHGWFVHIFADKLGVPVVLAKLGADLLVFSVGQLLVLRFLVFPTAKGSAANELPSGRRSNVESRIASLESLGVTSDSVN